ncbi:mu A [Mahlapitsi orthoreovirus]|uniref:Mu A n=1 Tax=Mahlapitsi orthoreovirus TaxID=2170064 RepID=A0A3G1DHL8_9REOV|nr:mu A [Mahlapitsi orthoreovirus]AMU04174.1 mu A [Mahlapitsi orthoreovirus]
MAYLAIPVPATSHLVDTTWNVIEQLTAENRNTLDNDVYVIDQTHVIVQLQNLVSSLPTNEVAQALLLRRWQHASVIRILPSKRKLVDYWRNNKSLAPESLPKALFGDTRSKEFYNALRNFKYTDYFTPVYSEQQDLRKLMLWLNQYSIVYSDTVNVLGAKTQLHVPLKYYDISTGILKEHQIQKHSYVYKQLPNARVYVGVIPSAGGGNSVCLNLEQWIPDSTAAILLQLMHEYHNIYFNTSREINVKMAVALLRGERKLNEKVSLKEARAAKSIGMVVRALRQPRHVNTALINIMDVIITCWPKIPSDPYNPTMKYQLVGVPTSLCHYMKISVSEAVQNVRESDGMFQKWFLTLILYSDTVKDLRKRRTILLSPTAGGNEIHFCRIDAFINYRCQDLPMNRQGRIAPYGICMAKGSFKSTLVDVISEFNVDNTQVIFSNTIVDSDEIGDRFDPTLEEMILDKLAVHFQVPHAKVPDVLCGGKDYLDLDIVSTVMFPIFRDVLHMYLTPLARKTYTDLNEVSRSLVFAHSDSELLNANWTGRLSRCDINFDDEMNVLMRKNRVGGQWFQLALSRCYKLYASPAWNEPVSLVLKSITVPWLDNATLLSEHPRALSSRVLAWYIPSSVMKEFGWCTCSEHFHVTYTFIRGHPDDLRILDLKNWKRYRARITVFPEVHQVVGDRRLVKVGVHWLTETVPLEMLEQRALFTPFQMYHLTMDCQCPVGRKEVVYKTHLTLAMIGVEKSGASEPDLGAPPLDDVADE